MHDFPWGSARTCTHISRRRHLRFHGTVLARGRLHLCLPGGESLEIAYARMKHGMDWKFIHMRCGFSDVKWVPCVHFNWKRKMSTNWLSARGRTVEIVCRLQLSLKLSAKELSLMETSTASSSPFSEWETLCKLLCPLKFNWIIVSDKWCEISAVIYGHSSYIN